MVNKNGHNKLAKKTHTQECKNECKINDKNGKKYCGEIGEKRRKMLKRKII